MISIRAHMTALVLAATVSPSWGQACDWNPLGTGVSPAANACAVLTNGDVVYGGVMNLAGSTPVGHVALWDGQGWQAMGAGVNNFVRALVPLDDGSVVAGGWFTIGGGPFGLVARWDGSNWSGFGSGLRAGTCEALAMTNDGELIAGGTFRVAEDQPAWAVASWNGLAWSKMGDNTLGGGVAGYFSGTNEIPAVRAIAVLPDSSVVIGGNFLSADGVSASGIARWDGQQWHPLGQGLNGPVEALCALPNEDVIAGGVFGFAGGVQVNGVARWDGDQWHAMGSGVTGAVWSLVTRPQGDVVVGGTFTEAGGITANKIALWDPTTGQWEALGSGVNPTIQSVVFGLATDAQGVVYAAGQFNDAAGSSNAKNAAVFGCLAVCAADFDGDGNVNGIDVGAFLQAYGTQNPAADMNHDGSINGIDVGLFLQAYAGGC